MFSQPWEIYLNHVWYVYYSGTWIRRSGIKFGNLNDSLDTIKKNDLWVGILLVIKQINL